MILRALKHMHFAKHADNCQHTLQNAFGNERMIDEKRKPLTGVAEQMPACPASSSRG